MPSARAGTSLVAKGRLVEPHRKCLIDVWSLALCTGRRATKGKQSAPNTATPCPKWVKIGKAQCEQMFSALHPKNGHADCVVYCPFRARSGHSARSRGWVAPLAGQCGD